MTLSTLFKRALLSACYVFSAIILLYSLLVICIYGGLGMNPVSVFLMFPLALVISFANNVVKHTNLSGVIKLFVHFTLVTLALVLFIYLPHGSGVSSGSAMIVFSLYVVLYAVCVGFYMAATAKKKRKDEKKSEYKNVF